MPPRLSHYFVYFHDYDTGFIPTCGHRDKKRTNAPRLFVFLHLLTSKVTDRFSISFFRRCAVYFHVGTEKLVKNQAISLLDIYEKKNMRGEQNPSSQARGAIQQHQISLSS